MFRKAGEIILISVLISVLIQSSLVLVATASHNVNYGNMSLPMIFCDYAGGFFGFFVLINNTCYDRDILNNITELNNIIDGDIGIP